MPEPSGRTDDKRPDPDFSASPGEKIATAVEELLGIVVRFVRTFLVFSFTPARAGETLAQTRPPDKSGLLRPSAFLFIGATLFSFLLGAIRHFSESKFPDYVVAIATKLGRDDFSFLALLIRAFPIIVMASLAAAIAGALVRTGSRAVRNLFVYVYGLQGIVLLLLVLAMRPLGKASLDEFDRLTWTNLVTRGDWYAVVCITDHTSGNVLASEHYRVDLENQR